MFILKLLNFSEIFFKNISSSFFVFSFSFLNFSFSSVVPDGIVSKTFLYFSILISMTKSTSFQKTFFFVEYLKS